MDTTPKSKVFSRRFHLAQDDSPVLFENSSQELDEEVDVLWDWQSPQTALINERRRRHLKRTISNHSPKIPVKRYPSSTQNFDKFHEELKALQAQLALPDDEASLCVSPQQEVELKGVADNIQHGEFDDFFNDSIDEQLIAFSQQIEEQLNADEPKTPETQKCDSSSIDKSAIFDDSLDDVFAALPDPELNSEENTATSNTITLSQCKREEIERNRLEALARLESKKQKKDSVMWKRTISEESPGNFIQTVSGRVEFHRTRSFELDALKQHPENLPNSVKEEIERKRLEALARLQAKRNNNKQETVLVAPPPTRNTPMIQCSPEEIEKKRLEAVKRQQNSIIEKKRQEALRRLEMNRSRAQHMNRTKLELLPANK